MLALLLRKKEIKSRSQTHMSAAIVAHTSHPNLTRLDSILEGLPTRQPGLLTAIRAVQQHQIYVTQPANIDRLLDAAAHSLVVCAVARELGGVVDVLAGEPFGVFGWVVEKIEDGLAGFALVVVHLGAVKGAVARGEGPADRVGGFTARHHVKAKLDLGHGLPCSQLGKSLSMLFRDGWMGRG